MKIQEVKNSVQKTVRKHKTAIAIVTTSLVWASINTRGGNLSRGFLEENNLEDQFTAYLEK